MEPDILARKRRTFINVIISIVFIISSVLMLHGADAEEYNAPSNNGASRAVEAALCEESASALRPMPENMIMMQLSQVKAENVIVFDAAAGKIRPFVILADTGEAENGASEESIADAALTVGTVLPDPVVFGCDGESAGSMYVLEKLLKKKVPETFAWPLDAKYTVITSPFGKREDPFTGEPSYHGGTDIHAPKGEDIYASKSGTVVKAMRSPSYGNYVMIDHGDNVFTLYAHCSALLVKKGDTVRQGDVIAKVGRTGSATNYHLHFEVLEGKTRVDALDYVDKPDAASKDD